MTNACVNGAELFNLSVINLGNATTTCTEVDVDVDNLTYETGGFNEN